jgi:glutamate mutase epsilon subunit
MAKKRRKLNKDFEKILYSSKKNVELVLAKIYDIDDEDIQKEYIGAFNGVVYFYDELKEDYQKQ